MTIVAFLQNQWFKDPVAVAHIYERHAGDFDRRAALNARFLFYKSLTGKRIRQTFGETLCHEIVWEEITTRLGVRSSDVFPADREHMRRVIDFHKPGVVLAFGRLATVAAMNIWPGNLIATVHPTARKNVIPELAAAARSLRNLIACSEAA